MLRLILPLVALSCTGRDSSAPSATDTGDDDVVARRILDLGPLPALPDDPTNAWADDPAASWFGRYLFYDPRLSGSGEFSCSTCHDPSQGFGDGLQVSEAAGTTGRHAPTLWNTGHNRWWFWDGRCDSLWCQAAGPVEAGREMDGSRTDVARLMTDQADLREGYEGVFGPLPDLSDTVRFPVGARPVAGEPSHPDQVAWDSMTRADQETVTGVFVRAMKAIAAFERTIQTGETAVDRYVVAYAADDQAAMDAALSTQEQAGLELFVGSGDCHLCHSGPLMSNLEFHSVGLGLRDWLPIEDLGRYDGIIALQQSDLNAASMWSDDPDSEAARRIDQLAHSSEQLGLFKTPSLRSVDTHAPYMHGGHFANLTEVVENYNTLDEEMGVGHIETFMVPREWDDEQVASLVAFLEALAADPLDPNVLSAPDTPLPP